MRALKDCSSAHGEISIAIQASKVSNKFTCLDAFYAPTGWADRAFRPAAAFKIGSGGFGIWESVLETGRC